MTEEQRERARERKCAWEERQITISVSVPRERLSKLERATEIGRVEGEDAAGVWQRVNLTVPFWAYHSLMMLGVVFIVGVPVGMALGIWEVYVTGLIGAAGVAWWMHRRYRMTILEQSEGVTITRVERKK